MLYDVLLFLLFWKGESRRNNGGICGKLPVEHKQTATYSYYHPFASHWPGCWVPSRPLATANSESQSLFFLCRALFQLNVPCQVGTWRWRPGPGRPSRSGARRWSKYPWWFLGEDGKSGAFWSCFGYSGYSCWILLKAAQVIEFFCRPKLMEADIRIIWTSLHLASYVSRSNHRLVSHIWGWFRIPMMGWMTKKNLRHPKLVWWTNLCLQWHHG